MKKTQRPAKRTAKPAADRVDKFIQTMEGTTLVRKGPPVGRTDKFLQAVDAIVVVGKGSPEKEDDTLDFIVPCYLDASALVKLVVDEGDGQALRDFVHGGANFATTPFCLNEALSILKSMWLGQQKRRKKITEHEYFHATQRLVIDAWSHRLLADDIGFIDPDVYRTVEALARRRKLDLSDALQLVTIRKGFYRGLVGPSEPALITADENLATAAALEHIRVWHCNKTPRPAWLS